MSTQFKPVECRTGEMSLAGDIATVAEMITGSHERDYVLSRDDVSALRRILTALSGTGEQSDCTECGGDGVAERIGGYERSCDACHGKGALPLPPQAKDRPMANDDLIERLLGKANYTDRAFSNSSLGAMYREAAARITTLKAELKTALDREESIIARYGAMHDMVGAELAMLRDDNAKLRAANAAPVEGDAEARGYARGIREAAKMARGLWLTDPGAIEAAILAKLGATDAE